MKKSTKLLRLLAASSLLVPVSATAVMAQDSVKLLTNSAQTFRALDNVFDNGRDSTLVPNRPMIDPDDVVTGSTTPVAGPDDVDLAALYYYAEHKQADRVEKETARLRLKYPDFQVPADLYDDPTSRNVDESPLWALYDKNDFDGIAREVEAMSRTYPGWSPSNDFREKLDRRKLRVSITDAYEQKDWAAVIDAGNKIDPNTETDADLMWMMIEAYRETGVTEGLTALYRGILGREGDNRFSDDVIVTTLQKATRDFPADEIRAAVAKIGTTPAMMVKLQPVSLGLLRREVGDFNADKARNEPLPEADIMKLRSVAEAQKAPADLSLLGWYYLKLKQPVEGMKWFKLALAAEANADNAKGLYLSLAQQKLEDEAYAVASEHIKDLSSDPEFLMNALSLRFTRPDIGMIDADVVESYSATIAETRSAAHAEILGWYAYNSRQFEAAEAWFLKAMEWEQSPARLKGLVLAENQLGKKAEVAILFDQFATIYPQIWEEIRTAQAPQARDAAVVTKPVVVAVDHTAAVPVTAYYPAQAPAQSVTYAQAPAPAYVQTAPAPAPARAAAPAPVRVNKNTGGENQASYYMAFKAKRYQACVQDLQSIEARQPLSSEASLIKGWCLHSLDRMAEARDAFAKALRGGGETRNDAAYGMALTLLRGKLTDEAESIISLYPLTAQRDREVRAEIYWQRARSAFDRKLYQRTLDALNARLKVAQEPADLSMLRGWAHYHLGHRTEARAIFSRLSQYIGNPAARDALELTSFTNR